MEVTNRFKELDLVDRVPEELWMEVPNIVQKVMTKTIPKKKKEHQRSSWAFQTGKNKWDWFYIHWSLDDRRPNQIDYILCSWRIIFFAALYSQQKQDQEQTVAQIMNSLLPNSDQIEESTENR